MLKLTSDQMAEIVTDGDDDELGEATPIEAALLMQGRILVQMMADLRARSNSCQYKFTVKRDGSNLITEIIAVPHEEDAEQT